MKDYSKMSDFEINKAVASSLGFKYIGRTWIDGADGIYHAVEKNDRRTDLPNYCNNPSDAWPLIESNLICLMADVFCEPQDGGKWIAQPAYGWQHERVRNDNPLRAAMIVYLMMKDEEQ